MHTIQFGNFYYKYGINVVKKISISNPDLGKCTSYIDTKDECDPVLGKSVT